MARTRSRPASPPVPGDAGAEVTDEPVQVISRAAAIDVAKGSGMVCLRLPHESRAGRRTQKVWEVTATFASVVALMDHLVCQGVERLVLESTSVIWGANGLKWTLPRSGRRGRVRDGRVKSGIEDGAALDGLRCRLSAVADGPRITRLRRSGNRL